MAALVGSVRPQIALSAANQLRANGIDKPQPGQAASWGARLVQRGAPPLQWHLGFRLRMMKLLNVSSILLPLGLAGSGDARAGASRPDIKETAA
jgi:hypothetical protein